jgi:purine nucleoside phosphorylase
VEPVVHGVRTAITAGARVVVLTNAAGGLRPEGQPVGDAVLISDHGAGPNRMNRVTVMRAAAGLPHILGSSKHVVIGYDGRHNFDVFAAADPHT